MTQWHTPNRAKRAGLALALVSPLLFGGPAQAADNLEFTGALVEAACNLRAGDDDIELNFNTVIDRYLYRYGLTPVRAFALRLQACDSQLLTGARLRLTGSESTELPGLLTLDGTSTANGVVIGLQSASGQALPVNGDDAWSLALAPGDLTIALQAYLEAEPSAQSSRNIVLQRFNATAFVALDYQ